MAQELNDWSVTAASNNAAAPNGWASGTMIPSEVEPTGRNMMAVMAKFNKDNDGSLTTGGTSTAYTLTLNSQHAAWFTGLRFRAKIHTASGATPTINPTGSGALGAKSLVKAGSTSIAASDLVSGQVYDFVYDGTNVQVVTMGGASSPTTTRGDLIYRGASADTRLAIGTSAQVLKGGTDPSWASVDGTMIRMGSDAQGDVLYFNGTNYVRLGAGTSGNFLKTNGAGANPAWAAAISAGTACVKNPYATSSSTVQAHGLGVQPKLVSVILECLTAEGNYSIGDKIDLTASIMSRSYANVSGPEILVDATNVTILIGNVGLEIVNKTGFATFVITAANWKVTATPYTW